MGMVQAIGDILTSFISSRRSKLVCLSSFWGTQKVIVKHRKHDKNAPWKFHKWCESENKMKVHIFVTCNLVIFLWKINFCICSIFLNTLMIVLNQKSNLKIPFFLMKIGYTQMCVTKCKEKICCYFCVIMTLNEGSSNVWIENELFFWVSWIA